MINRFQKVKLTGEAVSDKLYEIIERLSRGEYVTQYEIESTEEIKMARTNLSNSAESIDSPYRLGIQARIYNELISRGAANGIDNDGNVVYNGTINKSSRLDIVIGLCASGKSSALVDDISSYFHSRVIDCDEAKKMIPQYNDGWGSSVVHKES